jgi:predicted SAM-dependent methyltransferase
MMPSTTAKLRMNLGSGDFPSPGWTNVDAWNNLRGTDVICNVLDLASYFQPSSAEMIYCGHLLEHLPVEDVVPALNQIRVVLADDGQLCIVGPDYDKAVADGWDKATLAGIVDGQNRWPGDAHLWVASMANTLEMVRQVFPDAEPTDLRTLDPVWPCPFRTVDWQLCILSPADTNPRWHFIDPGSEPI